MRAIGRREVISLDLNDKVARATDLFKQHGISQMPVLDGGKLAGILTESDLLHQLMTGRVDKDTIVAEVMERKVVDGRRCTPARASCRASSSAARSRSSSTTTRAVLGILTKMDLIEMLAARKNPDAIGHCAMTSAANRPRR